VPLDVSLIGPFAYELFKGVGNPGNGTKYLVGGPTFRPTPLWKFAYYPNMRSSIFPPALLSIAVLFVAVSLTGCGIGTTASSGTGTLQIRGNIHGGQQAVSGASVRLYAAGKTGNGSAATSMLALPVTSDANGNFSITGDYVCTNLEDQVYVAALGGNPGLPAGSTNPALVMIDALGRCGNLPTTSFISVNELTTVAAAWALAPFMVSADHVGASSTNTAGIANAFLNARLLVDPTTGLPGTVASNLSIETGKIYALGNSLAACVNSNGGSACTPLFTAATPPGQAAPVNTLAAALNVVKNPSNNVAAVYNASTPFPPFPSGLASAPNDWTLSMTVTGGGVVAPTSLGIDAAGNVWAAGYYGVLSVFSPQGTPLSATGYGQGTLSESYGLTVDPNGDVWVTMQETPYHNPTRGGIAKFGGATSGSQGTLRFVASDTSLDYPNAVVADTNGNIMAANYANSSATIYNTTGGLVAGQLGSGSAAFPVAIAADSTHGLWLANQGDSTVTHVAANGTVLARPACCDGASGIAVDALGNAWVANYYNSSVSEVASNGTITLNGVSVGGLSYPSGIAIDGAQDVWVANYRATSFSHLAGNGGTKAAGTAYSGASGFGQDASLSLPYAIAPDASGTVWISNFDHNSLVAFFGLAAPTKTPLTPTPAQP
jgi:hypothetical protein